MRNPNEVTLYGRAKINLSLDVLEKLENGYHSLDMTMQSVNICDTLRIRKTFADNIRIYTNLSWLPTDERNLVYRTAKLLKEQYKIEDGIEITLQKKIPVSAGLAGGSTDCATTLIGIRNLFRLPISNDELKEIGKTLGADVPFCLQRGTARAKGIGEELTSLPTFPYSYIVVVKPVVSISTADTFQRLDINNLKKRPDTEQLIYYMGKGDLEGLSANLCNVLEEISIKRFPIIKNLKDKMIENGALGSLMTGSGSAVFGIFRTKKQAVQASINIKRNLPVSDIFVTTPFNNYD